MRSYVLIMALATRAYAWTYPDCEPDGCYRNLIDPRYTGQAPAFCIGWISGITTDAGAIPTQYHNCPHVAPLSSACSCIAYTATISDCTTETPTTATNSFSPVITSSQPQTTASAPPLTTSSETVTEYTTETEASTVPPVTTSTILQSTTANHVSSTELFTSENISSIEESSSVGTQSPTQSTTLWTTLTIFTTSTDTITKCHATATNCPGKSTVILTSVISLSTTVCPLTGTEAPLLPAQSQTESPPSPSSSEFPPTNQFPTETHPPQAPQTSGCLAGQEHGPNGDCNVTSHSTEALLHPPQSSGCPDGATPSIKGECTPVALTSTWSPPPLPAVTQPPATSAGTHVSTVPSSNSPSVVTAGTDRFGFDAAIFVICVAAALI